MKEEIIQYVQNQLAHSPNRLKSFIQEKDGWVYPKRYLYYKIEKYLKSFLKSVTRKIPATAPSADCSSLRKR